MRFISFFAGIGGIDLGLERAGHECVGQVEIDTYCNKVLEKHWPSVTKWRDICGLTGKELPEADLWAGGFPCQDVSVAGKRAGITGERSGLFFEFMRLVCVVRPRYLLLENVPGLLSGGMDAVLGELAQSGYDAEWSVFPACAVAAPHMRKRVFIVAYTRGERLEGLHSRLDQKLSAESLETFGQIWKTEPDICRVALGVPSRVDRLRCLGNAVVPQVAEWIGQQLNANK